MAEGDPQPKWFDSLDDETKNYITSRGLADAEPAAAFANAAKAHREAQAFIGVPAEQVLRLPKADAPPEEWAPVWQRLGYSPNADDYKLDDIKYTDGTELEAPVRDFIREQAQALHLSPAQAKAFAQASIAFSEKAATEDNTTDQAAQARALEQLRNSWGPNYEANQVIADNAYRALMQAANLNQEQMAAAMTAIRDSTGRVEAMQMLLALGQRITEDTFTTGAKVPGDANALIATREQAQAKKAELLADGEWCKRFSAGGQKEKDEMAKLDMRIAGFNERGEPL